jgi:uncharacterized protein with HEPN domain
LSDELKARHPNIAWKGMAGAGNVYRHDYQDIAALRIWNAVQFALPPLRNVVEQELAQRSSVKGNCGRLTPRLPGFGC